MRISKYELLTEIAMLCDNFEDARRDLAAWERRAQTCEKASDGEGLSAIDVYCIEAGRKKLFGDCTYSWRNVTASRNEETGAIQVTKFEKFRESVFHSCPDWISKREFFEYFDAEFQALYEEQKAKAIAELKESENEENEDA